MSESTHLSTAEYWKRNEWGELKEGGGGMVEDERV